MANSLSKLMNAIKHIFRIRRVNLSVVHAHRKSLVFHYRSHSNKPDTISLYLTDEDVLPYFTWNWIDGHDAYPPSMLGRLHSLYEASTPLNSVSRRSMINESINRVEE